MKRIRKIVCLSIVISVNLLCFSSCGKIHMDEEKCAEVALEYMINKYGKEFILIDSSEKMGISGPMGYAVVTVGFDGSEEDYRITIYPDSKSDKDKDGYYDSYKVISDDYMCTLVEDYVTEGMTELLKDASMVEFSCTASMKTVEYVGEWGITSDFPIPTQETFSIKNVLQNYPISIYCWVKIPESQNNEMLQEDIERVIRPLIVNSDVTFDIYIYENEDYAKIKEKNNDETVNKIKEKESIYFYIMEEN